MAMDRLATGRNGSLCAASYSARLRQSTQLIEHEGAKFRADAERAERDTQSGHVSSELADLRHDGRIEKRAAVAAAAAGYIEPL
jgi:hypothetical protein